MVGAPSDHHHTQSAQLLSLALFFPYFTFIILLSLLLLRLIIPRRLNEKGTNDHQEREREFTREHQMNLFLPFFVLSFFFSLLLLSEISWFPPSVHYSLSLLHIWNKKKEGKERKESWFFPRDCTTLAAANPSFTSNITFYSPLFLLLLNLSSFFSQAFNTLCLHV